MKIGIIKEKSDNRVAIVPDLVKKLIGEGNEVIAEKGCGESALFTDDDYTEAGAKLTSRSEVLKSSEMLCTIVPLEKEEYGQLSGEAIVISSFQPYNTLDYTKKAEVGSLSAFSMDMIPRITIAQAMDVLSSMASIAGYKAVILAANHLPKYFPMLTTAAGSIPPAKVLVMGAGVAGLQAIATAKRLGSVVQAFDTRAAAKEEVALIRGLRLKKRWQASEPSLWKWKEPRMTRLLEDMQWSKRKSTSRSKERESLKKR